MNLEVKIFVVFTTYHLKHFLILLLLLLTGKVNSWHRNFINCVYVRFGIRPV